MNTPSKWDGAKVGEKENGSNNSYSDNSSNITWRISWNETEWNGKKKKKKKREVNKLLQIHWNALSRVYSWSNVARCLMVLCVRERARAIIVVYCDFKIQEMFQRTTTHALTPAMPRHGVDLSVVNWPPSER